jgi:hypothetical protein
VCAVSVGHETDPAPIRQRPRGTMRSIAAANTESLDTLIEDRRGRIGEDLVGFIERSRRLCGGISGEERQKYEPTSHKPSSM